MKIRHLYVLNILEEMASENLNRRIDDKFYDYFMHKGLDWLLDNAEKIVNDFYNNISKFGWELEHANEFFPIFSKSWGKDGAKGSEQWIKDCIEEMKEEM